MYIVGFIIFGLYMALTIWNINNGSKETEKETEQNYSDIMDMDGMGNYGRFPNEDKIKSIRGRKNTRKTTRKKQRV